MKERYEIINQDDMICAYADCIDDARRARQLYANRGVWTGAYIWDTLTKKEVK